MLEDKNDMGPMFFITLYIDSICCHFGGRERVEILRLLGTEHTERRIKQLFTA